MKYIENIPSILLFTFIILSGILILLGNRDGTCSAEDSSLFETHKTYLFGNECTNSVMFWIVCILAIIIQIARNILWIKNSQATREALKVNTSKRDFGVMLPLLLYTFASTSLYIFSILIILGGNMIILFCILIGNLVGVALSMSEQDADKERLTTAVINMRSSWEKLSKKNYKDLTKQEKIEYNNMQEVKDWVQSWLMQTENKPGPMNTEYQSQLEF